MRNRFHISSILISALMLSALGCRTQESNQQPQNSNSAPIAVSNPTPSNRGSIKITSEPPGASVMLIEQDEAGARFPQPKGTTPITINSVSPGKYAVHLELKGFKSFQKDVEIKGSETLEITAKLKR